MLQNLPLANNTNETARDQSHPHDIQINAPGEAEVLRLLAESSLGRTPHPLLEIRQDRGQSSHRRGAAQPRSPVLDFVIVTISATPVEPERNSSWSAAA